MELFLSVILFFLYPYQIYHASFFKLCKKKRAVKEAFRFTKLIPNPTLSTFNMLMSVCASSQDIEGDFNIHIDLV